MMTRQTLQHRIDELLDREPACAKASAWCSTLLWVGILLAVSVGNGSPAKAQFVEEVWIEPNWFHPLDITCDPVADGCCGFRLNPFRDDWLPTVLDPQGWPTVHSRTDVFSMLIGILAVPCSAGSETFQRLTDTDLEDLVGALGEPAHPIRVNFDVGGIRVNNGGAFCGDTAGETLANANFTLLNRWYEAGGQIDHLSLDHPVWWTLTSQADSGFPCSEEDKLTWQEAAEEVGDYFDTLRTLVDNAHGSGTFRPQIGLWESSGGYYFEAIDGTLYEPLWSPTTEVIHLDQVVSAVDEALESRGFDLDAFLIDLGPNAVQGLGTPEDWNFDRVIAIEKLMRSMGFSVGISNHLGPCANGTLASSCSMIDPALVDDQWAHDTFLRYATDYVAAGGSPDLLQAYAWHKHPTLTGPEDLENSFMDIAKDVLTEVYPSVVEVPYFEDTFERQTLGAPWSASASWSIIQSVVLEQSDSPPPSQTSVALLDGEVFGNADVEYSTRLLAGTGWAGVHLRKADPAGSPWTSGYLVYLRPNGQLSLYRPGANLASIATGTNPTLDWVRVKVSLRGSRIRVEINGNELIDVTDDTYTSGQLSLITLDQAARYDDLAITQLRLASTAFADDFDDQDTAGWQLDGGTWTAATGQMSETSGQNLALASIAGSTFNSIRASARIKLGTGTGWAGFQLRKGAPESAPWSAAGGYLVHVSNNGSVTLYKNGTGTLAQSQTGLDFSASFADLKVTVVDHRIMVSVNGTGYIDFWDDAFETGYFSLVTFNRQAVFDDFLVESLD